MKLTKWKRQAQSNGRNPELYNKWHNMLSRCKGYNKDAKENYKDVSYDPRWESYDAFAEDVTEAFEYAKEQYGPNVKLSIDRIDPFGDYVKENIRFISRYESGINKRTDLSYTHLGKTLRINEWARMYKMPERVLYTRLMSYGWTIARALNEPVHKVGKKASPVDLKSD